MHSPLISSRCVPCERSYAPLAPSKPKRAKSAFVQQIIPGVLGGIASAMCLYPLEVFETLLQGEAANGSETGSIIARTSKPKRVWSANKFHYEKTIGAIETDPLYLQAVAPSSLQIAQTAWARGALLHGADMALLSALFGFTAFFSALELTAPLGNSVWILFARNLFAAWISFLFNTPFQLLKTTTVLSDGVPATRLARSITSNFTHIDRLWNGMLANSLGVIFVAVQFTLYPILCSIFPYAGPSGAAIIGMLGTALSAALTYPVLSVRTAVMSQNNDSNSDGEGDRCLKRIIKAAKKMARNGTLYNGVVTNVLRTTLPSGILFGVRAFFL